MPYVDDGVSTMPTPTERATLRLERATQYWPLTIGSTQIFNMGAVADPLIKLIVQAELSDDQIIECKKASPSPDTRPDEHGNADELSVVGGLNERSCRVLPFDCASHSTEFTSMLVQQVWL